MCSDDDSDDDDHYEEARRYTPRFLVSLKRFVDTKNMHHTDAFAYFCFAFDPT